MSKCGLDECDLYGGCLYNCELDGEMSEWKEDCVKWWGKILTGQSAHRCYDWDGLPIDETCDEFDCCICYKK